MRRVFDQALYDEFMTKIGTEGGGGSITEIDQENEGFKNWSGKNPKPISMVEDYDTIHIYFKDLYDFQVQARPKVEKIFEETQAADSNNGAKTDKLLEETAYYQDAINVLLADIRPADGSAAFYPPEVISHNLIQYDRQLEYEKGATLAGFIVTEVRDANGKLIEKIYDWDRIEKILHSEKLEVHEKIGMAMVIQGMTTIKENDDGTVKVETDWESMERLTGMFYETTVNQSKHDPAAGVQAYFVMAEHRFTPNAQAIIECYTQEVGKEIELAYTLFPYDGSKLLDKEQQMTVDFVKEEMLKVGILNTLKENGTVTTNEAYPHEELAREAAEKAKSFDIQITEITEGKPHYIVKIGDDIEKTVYPFSMWKANDGINHANINVVESTRRDKDLEQMDSDRQYMNDMTEGNISNLLIGTVKKYGSVMSTVLDNAWVTAMHFAGDAARNTQIDMQHYQLDQYKENNQLSRVYDAYSVGGVTYTGKDGESRGIIVFDETDLEIRAHAYGTTAAELKNQFYSGDPTQTAAYTEWWNNHEQGQKAYKNYRDELNEVYLDYLRNNPQVPNKGLERLTPAQINELDKKASDPNHELNL
ncbi:MAG: hypothetical protein FWG14_10465 [Peptococcaceae bacterium]|nr:hypothetical protein [Peptococcaceae bacterium]